MTRNTNRVQLQVLVEDKDSRDFANAALAAMNVGRREIDIEDISSQRLQSNRKQALTIQFERAVKALISRAANRRAGLLVLTDADNMTVNERQCELWKSLSDHNGTSDRKYLADLNVYYWIPKWHIETWALWFNGNSAVTEDDRYKSEADLRDVSFSEAGRRFVALLKSGNDGPQHLPALGAAIEDARRLASWLKADF